MSEDHPQEQELDQERLEKFRDELEALEQKYGVQLVPTLQPMLEVRLIK